MNPMMSLKITLLFCAVSVAYPLQNCFAEKLFVCNKSDLANKYWFYLNKKTTLDRNINHDYIDSLYNTLIHDKSEAVDPKTDHCIWIEGKSLSFFTSDGAGALAITDGMHDIWFKNKASFGWINSQFYTYLKNKEALN